MESQFVDLASDDSPQVTSLLTLETQIEPDWIDYNGHMTEWQYYKVLADAGENFLRAAGFTEEYRSRGFSFFSVEGHLRNLKECRAHTPLKVYTDLVGFDEVRLRIYQYVVDADRSLTVATGEHMMLHVDTLTRKATALQQCMHERLAEIAIRTRPRLQPRGLGARISYQLGGSPTRPH